jgi:hypothetical protein
MNVRMPSSSSPDPDPWKIKQTRPSADEENMAIVDRIAIAYDMIAPTTTQCLLPFSTATAYPCVSFQDLGSYAGR